MINRIPNDPESSGLRIPAYNKSPSSKTKFKHLENINLALEAGQRFLKESEMFDCVDLTSGSEKSVVTAEYVIHHHRHHHAQ